MLPLQLQERFDKVRTENHKETRPLLEKFDALQYYVTTMGAKPMEIMENFTPLQEKLMNEGRDYEWVDQMLNKNHEHLKALSNKTMWYFLYDFQARMQKVKDFSSVIAKTALRLESVADENLQRRIVEELEK